MSEPHVTVTDSLKTKGRKLGKKRPRDASASKELILTAALIEFAEKGYAGARVDEIARQAGVSKPLIYDYFGDKDAVYTAALREAYVRIRAGEERLNLDELDPIEAIEMLVKFTIKHFRENPWFISMLNTENLRGGHTIRTLEDAAGIQTKLLDQIERVVSRGIHAGLMGVGISAVDLYIKIASLCYFPISNRHTLESVFEVKIDDDWLDKHTQEITQMVLAYVRSTRSS